MIKRQFYILMLALGVLNLESCEKKETVVSPPSNKPIIRDKGNAIEFSDSASINYFKTAPVRLSQTQAEFSAPARVIATIVRSVENNEQNLVLFDNPDLTFNYTSFLQYLINIKTYKANLARVKDLSQNGAATGKEVIEAETLLANERAGIIEHEAKLKLAGLDPEELIKAKVNSIWIICDIPEGQIENIKANTTCNVQFSAFPEKTFKGRIEALGEVVDQITRMIKLRISVINTDGQLKAGMFALVKFSSKEGKFLSIPKDALVIVQGKTYVFVRKTRNTFERREVTAGDPLGDEVIVFHGLTENENVVISGAMQLKGLSFGF